MSMTELAEHVGLTVTPCIERVRRLERDGIITGYHARVAPAALDAGLLVFVEISMSSKSDRTFDDFRREILCIPQVRSEEHTSELQSLMRISYAVSCLKKKKRRSETTHTDYD